MAADNRHYVISASIDMAGQSYRIDMAEPEVFARWVAHLLAARPPTMVMGAITIRTLFAGLWP